MSERFFELKAGATVYVAGPMTGLPDYNRAAFNRAAARVLARYKWVALNPARHPDGLEYEEYMRRGLRDVAAADAILLLPGWENSPGAKRELAAALALGKKILVEREESGVEG